MNSASIRQNLAFQSQPVPSWPVQAFQLVTLLDMQPFLADIFIFAVYHLDAFECEINRAIDARGAESPMTREEVSLARSRFKVLETRSKNLELASVVEHLGDIEVEFIQFDHMPDKYPVTLSQMAYQMSHLRKRLARDLGARMFMTIRMTDAGYYEQEQLFGLEVFSNFPSARMDVTEAGNCYATGRYTACAFHCSRVAERGLFALAHDMNNRFGVVIKFGDKDIERVNWGNLIQKIEKEVEKLLDPNRLPKVDPADVLFYSKTAKEFAYLKNGWRDEVAHSRVFYEQSEEAKVFMDHVKTFMSYLAAQGLTE